MNKKILINTCDCYAQILEVNYRLDGIRVYEVV